MKNSAKRFSIGRLFSDNRFLIAFSVIAAFIFWLVIVIDQNPVRTKTMSNLTVNINIKDSVAGTMGIDVTSDNYVKSATVTVSGPNYLVSSLKNEDINVYADLSEVTDAGTYTLPLIAERLNGTGYTVVDIVPSSIDVSFDYMDTREFEITVKADGISADSGLIIDVPTVSSANESVLNVRGSKNDVDRIASAVAVLSKTETISATKTYDSTPIFLYDSVGNPIDSTALTLSVQKVKVTVPVCKKAELPVLPTFTDEPYEGLGSQLIASVSARSVTVIGPPATIDAMKNVQLAKIDFSDISLQSLSFDMAFSLPDGVRVLDGLEYVTVTLHLDRYTTTGYSIAGSAINYKNVGNGMTAQSKGIQNVTVCGPRDEIKRLTSSDMYAEVDLTGKTAGEYTIPATVYCRDSDLVWAVGDYTVAITIQ